MSVDQFLDHHECRQCGEVLLDEYVRNLHERKYCEQGGADA